MMLSESKAWEKIGRAYYKEPEKRNYKENYLVEYGMCDAIDILHIECRITNDTCRTMLDRLCEVKDTNDYWYATGFRSNDFIRGDFCFLQKFILESK